MKRLLFLILLASPVWATTYHVTTTGNRANNGLTEGAAWPLQYAIYSDSTGGGSIVAGDTILIHGGTYSGIFWIKLSGTSANPIKIMAHGSERVTIDGGTAGSQIWVMKFHNSSDYVWLMGVEVTSSSTDRWSTDTVDQSNPSDVSRPRGISVHSAGDTLWGIKIINCIVHDCAEGPGSMIVGADVEMTGNLIWGNGWMGINLGHGNGTYDQNKHGRKRFKQNIIWGNFTNGMQLYGSASAFADSMTVDEVVSFNNGEDTVDGHRNLVWGTSGDSRCVSDSCINSHFYRKWSLTSATSMEAAGVNFGYGSGLYAPVITGNYFTGALMNTGVEFQNDTLVTFTGNTLWCQDQISGWDKTDYPGNYYATDGGNYPDTGDSSFVAQNPYDTTRAQIVVYNFDNGDSVSIDVSSVYSDGQLVSIRNAQNYYEDAAYSASVVSGHITVPMMDTRWTKVSLTGWDTTNYENIYPEFGVFIGTLDEGTDTVIVSGSLSAFTAQKGDTSAEQSYSVSGTNLADSILVTAPTGFRISTTSGSGYVQSLGLTPTGGTVASTTIYVTFWPTAWQSYSGNITHTSTGATQQNVYVYGVTPGARRGFKHN